MKPTPLLQAVRRALAGPGGPSAGETLVAALSGGADSVALLDALVAVSAESGFRVVAAHLDHALRPDSAEDVRFCRELCARLGVPFRSAREDVAALAERAGEGIEEAGRRARYAFLRSVRQAEGAAAIALAHTCDDQAETVLLRLLRGSGSLGLGAMRPRTGDVLRPLLAVGRAEVLEHLAVRGLAWREDPTNGDPAFLRNRVRHELLPYLESRFNPGVRGALARAAALLADEADHLSGEARALLAQASRTDGDGVALDRRGLTAASRAVARIAVRLALESSGGLRGVSAVHVERILALAAAKAPSGRRLPLPGRREVVARFGELRVGPRTAQPAPFAYPLPVPGRVDLPSGLRVVARAAPGPAVSKEEAAVVPAPDGEGLVVRNRRPGDRLRLGGGEVSLRRFLMARRVPADLRAGLPVVAAGRSVLWVPGQPGDAPTAAATRYVRLEVERA